MMNDLAIRVCGLGKRYPLGGSPPHRTLREALTEFHPLRRLFESSRPSSRQHIWALRDVSFEVKKGEIVGVIGRNGSGKSTLLKILSRITEPTEGQVEIHGRVGSLLEIGMGFHSELTGRENAYLSGTILGMKKLDIDRKFEEIVAFAGVEKFIDTPVKRYSSGMYVRLAFAIAAHLEPDILLVDEVLAVGDVEFQNKCLEKMNSVAGQGRTVLFVSHNMMAVTTLCRRGLLLEGGRAKMNDEINKVVGSYLAAFRSYQTPFQGVVSLRDHPGRRKVAEGVIRLIHCKLVDKNQAPNAIFKTGDEMRLVVGYQMTTPIKNSALVFNITFNDLMQHRLFTCSNELVGCEFKRMDSVGEIQCVIPKLPLVPGRYTINIACKVGPVWSDGVYEAAEFQVIAGDFYGTHRLPPEGFGNALVEHRWTPNP